MSRRRSVRQLLQTLLVINTLAVLLVGVIGALAVNETTRTVDTLSQELSPAQQSNARFMEAMLDSETELRAFLISGEEAQLADYRAALELAPKVEVELQLYVEDHPELATLVAAMDRAAKAWVDDFAAEAIRIGGGPGSYRPALYELGVRRFDAIKKVSREIASELQADVVEARAAARDTMNATLGLMAAIGLLAALGCSALGWWALRSIRQPLSSLEEMVDRLASGEREARAPDVGPTEIRRLGVALNELAEENARVRDLGVPHAAAADGGRPRQVGVRLERLPRAPHPADQHLGLSGAAGGEPPGPGGREPGGDAGDRPTQRRAAARPDRGPAGPQQRRATARAPRPRRCPLVDRRSRQGPALLRREPWRHDLRGRGSGRTRGPSYSPTQRRCTARSSTWSRTR